MSTHETKVIDQDDVTVCDYCGDQIEEDEPSVGMQSNVDEAGQELEDYVDLDFCDYACAAFYLASALTVGMKAQGEDYGPPITTAEGLRDAAERGEAGLAAGHFGTHPPDPTSYPDFAMEQGERAASKLVYKEMDREAQLATQERLINASRKLTFHIPNDHDQVYGGGVFHYRDLQATPFPDFGKKISLSLIAAAQRRREENAAADEAIESAIAQGRKTLRAAIMTNWNALFGHYNRPGHGFLDVHTVSVIEEILAEREAERQKEAARKIEEEMRWMAAKSEEARKRETAASDEEFKQSEYDRPGHGELSSEVVARIKEQRNTFAFITGKQPDDFYRPQHGVPFDRPGHPNGPRFGSSQHGIPYGGALSRVYDNSVPEKPASIVSHYDVRNEEGKSAGGPVAKEHSPYIFGRGHGPEMFVPFSIELTLSAPKLTDEALDKPDDAEFEHEEIHPEADDEPATTFRPAIIYSSSAELMDQLDYKVCSGCKDVMDAQHYHPAKPKAEPTECVHGCIIPASDRPISCRETRDNTGPFPVVTHSWTVLTPTRSFIWPGDRLICDCRPGQGHNAQKSSNYKDNIAIDAARINCASNGRGN